MTLPMALRKALAIVRDKQVTVYFEASQCRYRMIPDRTLPRGYTLWLSMRLGAGWTPWGEANHFDMSDILNDKWRVVV